VTDTHCSLWKDNKTNKLLAQLGECWLWKPLSFMLKRATIGRPNGETGFLTELGRSLVYRQSAQTRNRVGPPKQSRNPSCPHLYPPQTSTSYPPTVI